MGTNTKVQHPLEQHSMYALLDYKASYQACKQLLCTYCDAWRENRKAANKKAGRHGGVTANTRDLVRAILRILPPSMDYIKHNKKAIYATCLKTGLYAIQTTSGALRRQMAERQEGDETQENDLVSRSTVFELLKTLEAAGIIHSRKSVVNSNDKDLRAMLIFINPAAIVTYVVNDELPELPHAVTDTKNENLAEVAPGGPAQEIVQFSDYYNANIVTCKNENNTHGNVNNVSPSGDGSIFLAEKVQSTANKTPAKMAVSAAAAPGEFLWKICAEMLYPGENFNMDVQAQAIHLLDAHYQAALSHVEALRSNSIANFTRSAKYMAKAPSAKPAYLRYFMQKMLYFPLRDVEKTALGLCVEALKIRAQLAAKKGKKTYYPTVFLSQSYGFASLLKLAKKDLCREGVSAIVEQSAIIRVKTTLRGWVGTFATLVAKNIGGAALQCDHLLQKSVDLLKIQDFSDAEKRHYYEYFKMELLAILNTNK